MTRTNEQPTTNQQTTNNSPTSLLPSYPTPNNCFKLYYFYKIAMIKNINDRIIVNLIRTGDSSAYLLLYDNYAPLLYGIIYRIVKEETEAEQILEKTILKIWETRASHDREKLGFSVRIINIARSFARQGKVNVESKESETSSKLCILDLILAKGLNIGQAANRLRINVSQAMVKLRTELKEKTSIKN